MRRFGLWATTDRGELYPNPSSALFSGVPDDVAFEFIGRVLGKALYEGITIGPLFARFFLVKLLGRPANLHHLSSLDFELYKNCERLILLSCEPICVCTRTLSLSLRCSTLSEAIRR